jgi:hypothetical protein
MPRRTSYLLASILLFCWFVAFIVNDDDNHLQQVMAVLTGTGSALFAGAANRPQNTAPGGTAG